MSPSCPRFILLFLDGVGLGPAGSANPLAADAAMPWLMAWLNYPLVLGRQTDAPQRLFKAIDATLQVPGLPQSATGQATLYTGCNASQFLGRHQTGFANGALRPLITAKGVAFKYHPHK
jgi:hypothetical protein